MEGGAVGVAASRGGSMSMPSLSSQQKKWRAVSDHHPGRSEGVEEMELTKLDQSDERAIYEQGRENVDMDFCSVMVDGSLDNDRLQQRLHSVARQREELQQIEIELKVQFIARSEIIKMQNSFDAQNKEHANTCAKLQELLHDKERIMHELERKIEEKDRELHAIRLDNEAAWAKEDILIEQNKELANFRRELDHSEAERAQNKKQMHDLTEHLQEKDRQFLELQEQHRVAQETLLYKDEQLREAQVWISRIQEMDALQSNTNHSLQAELRERTEQYTQLWLGCQRQFVEMERLHVHAMQQLQLQLTDTKEKNSSYPDESGKSQTNSQDTSKIGQNTENEVDSNGGTVASGKYPNGNTDAGVHSFASSGSLPNQSNHVPGMQIPPSSLLGMPAYFPPGQVTALHSYVMHQQQVPQSLPPHDPLSHVGQFQSMPIEHWQNQAVSDGSEIYTQNKFQPPQADQGTANSDVKYQYEASANGQVLQSDQHVHNSQGPQRESMSSGKGQVLEQNTRNYAVPDQSERNLQQISSQFHKALRLDVGQNRENENIQVLNNHGVEGQLLAAGKKGPTVAASPSNTSLHSCDVSETSSVINETGSALPETLISTGAAGRTSETALLDERSLLACIVRTIPAGGKIRISSTLPNRLGKMLAPLHWQDYRKMYGKLDEFVSSHPELFFIEDDFIQLRDGAHKMIAASAAVAKVAAAAATSSVYSPFLAVTPMAQPQGLKKTPSLETNSVRIEKTTPKEYAVRNQASAIQNQQPNGAYPGIVEGSSSVKILSKSKDPRELNGVNSDRSRTSTQGRPNSDSSARQQGRTGASFPSRR